MTDLEWPTATTNALWRTIVAKLGKHPHVWWGVSNEPEYNFDGAQDAQVGLTWVRVCWGRCAVCSYCAAHHANM